MGAAISSTQFFLYGKRHFTRTGYERHVKKYTEAVQNAANIGIGAPGADGVDMTGKVVVVTGANSGLGKEVATYCAAKGAKLYMLCRSKDRAETAKKEIVEMTGNDSVDVVVVDVGELSQVRDAAKSLQGKEKTIDCLVCNAGVLLNDKQESSEGNEATFASHLLGGTYLLSKLLMPQIEASEEGRIVVVTSGGMYSTYLPSWETLTSVDGKKYNGVDAYAYAKRGQVILAERWAAEYPKVKIVTAHPGWSDTKAVTEAFGSSSKYLEPLRKPWQGKFPVDGCFFLLKMLASSPNCSPRVSHGTGAEGISWLTATKAENLKSGEFYLDRLVAPKHISGPFFTEGSYTKNTDGEIDTFLKKLAEVAKV